MATIEDVKQDLYTYMIGMNKDKLTMPDLHEYSRIVKEIDAPDPYSFLKGAYGLANAIPAPDVFDAPKGGKK